jgi:MULE transposase domain
MHVLKDEWKGTLYIATIRSALEEIFPIAFGIPVDNECFREWKYFANNLKIGIPVLAEEYHNGVKRNISDQDKGMARACKEIFPTHHSLNCAVHIQQNVQ